MRILKLAAPYDPFPPELSAKHDEIRIAYEWQFLDAGQGSRCSMPMSRRDAGVDRRRRFAGPNERRGLPDEPAADRHADLGRSELRTDRDADLRSQRAAARSASSSTSRCRCAWRDLRAAGNRAAQTGAARASGAARRPDADRSRLRRASGPAGVGFDAQGIRHIHVTTSRDILAAMARGQGPTEAVVALGYAGWEGGQLEDEIRANAWLSAPVDSGLIFDTAVRIALARGRAPAGRRALAHQPDQRQCLRHRPLGRRAPPGRRRRCSGVRFRTKTHRRRLRRHREPQCLAARTPWRPQGPPWETIDALMREWQPGVLVVGLPYNVDDSESAA
jgi:hypothetical protein